MAYTKNTWTDGDIVTSEKLNHMEDGIANSENVFIVGGIRIGETGYEGTLDKTWQEIHDAMMQNKICIVVIATDGGFSQVFINEVSTTNGTYLVTVDGVRFSTSTASGYPIGIK